MKRRCLSLAATALLVAAPCLAAGPLWGYEGEMGPAHWGELDPAFAVCASGVNQSPVDLHGFIEAELEPLTFKYTGLVTEIVNNGHTVQANYTAGSTLQVGGKVYELKQFHFHAPSENTLEGKSFPMEAHFVHAAEDGSLAVVAVLFTFGNGNGGIEKLWEQMPTEAGKKVAMAAQVRAGDLMPENREYYRFNGSLTTPPCTEGVLWLVLKEPVSVSEEQVERFAHVMHHPNNRPVQPLHARAVLK